MGTFRPAPERILTGGIRLVAPFIHEGAAKVLMHHLKYRGVTDFAELAADLLETRLPPLPLVPVPRALSRRLKYGVDPARAIAAAVGRRLRVPVVDALAAPMHRPRRAGRDHSREVPRFRMRTALPGLVVLVDDVVTTGATVYAAAKSLGLDQVHLVAAANVVPDPSNLGPHD